MDHTFSEADGNVPAAPIGDVPNHTDTFRTLPNDSEPNGTIPNPSEHFRPIPNPSERHGTSRKQAHTVTVREAARMFEAAGVARTERSIVKWCQRDASGSARLDAYFDMNERRYYMTEQSIQAAIAEEKAKAFRNVQNGRESLPNSSETAAADHRDSAGEQSSADAEKLTKELLDLQILNAGKDFLIAQLREERDKWIQQTIDGSRKIGELENRLLQLEDPIKKSTREQSSDEIRSR